MKKNSIIKSLKILGILLGVIYLMNPTAGVIELIPDNLPFIGNIDEAAVVFFILKYLRDLGINLTGKTPKPDND